MSGSSALVYSPEVVAYDHGPQHPLRPVRVRLTRELIAAYGVLDDGRVTEVPPPVASDEEVQLVHTAGYIDAVKRAGAGEPGEWWRYGLGPGDNPIFPAMHEASARVVGGSVTGARLVLEGEVEHAFNPAGGLHHAMPDRASGFCVYDDPAVAIAWLLERGAERVAYVDVDVHHGDGPQAIFYEDPRVLTISLHESGRYLFPGTGFTDERGAGDAEGSKVNVPLQPYTADEAWLMAFREVVPPLVRRWAPDVLVTQLGCDTHHSDPLAHLALSTRAYREAAAILHELAHEAAGGRWLATGGGGYQWARVVPRAWTLYFAEMAERPVDDRIPDGWIDLARDAAGGPVPERLSEDPPATPGEVGAEVERVLAEVRVAVLSRPNDPTS